MEQCENFADHCFGVLSRHDEGIRKLHREWVPIEAADDATAEWGGKPALVG
jgi:hypothetical protein